MLFLSQVQRRHSFSLVQFKVWLGNATSCFTLKILQSTSIILIKAHARQPTESEQKSDEWHHFFPRKENHAEWPLGQAISATFLELCSWRALELASDNFDKFFFHETMFVQGKVRRLHKHTLKAVFFKHCGLLALLMTTLYKFSCQEAYYFKNIYQTYYVLAAA